ncbi:MAG: LysM peptidoglycan-binding domain-containing protein [Saprospiraceae bacterium]
MRNFLKNLRKIAQLGIGLYLGIGIAQAQTQPAPLLTSKDTLLLKVHDNAKYIYHPCKEGHTLYSIAKFYSLAIEEIYEINPKLREDPTLRIGARIAIPVPNAAIKRYKTENFDRKTHVPIYYVVQHGETLFGIAKRNFEMPVDTILKRNNLSSSKIRPGQLLFMGWMSTEGIKAEWRGKKTPVGNDALRDEFEKEKTKNGNKLTEAQGVCFWQKDVQYQGGDLYALHRLAAIGSVIAVTNGMTQRTVYAKVIGRIPAGIERGAEVILSPAAAKKIGAVDPRFFVKIKYFK